MTEAKKKKRTRKRKRRRANRNPRGPEGSVRGVPAEQASEILVALVRYLGAFPSEERRRAAADYLRREHGYEQHTIDGFLWALFRMPGVRHGGRGELFFTEPAVAYARHRDWKIALGRADLADARALAKALAAAPQDDLTPNLQRLWKRLLDATTPLISEAER